MNRERYLNWLSREATHGPADFQRFAREVHKAIVDQNDDVSTEALQWLDMRASAGSHWAEPARACLDEIDRLCRRDTEPCLPPWPVVSEVPAESGVQHV